MSRGVPPGKARTRQRTHPYVAGPTPGCCATCGLIEAHVSHDLAPVPDEQRAAENRRIGERGS